MITKKPLISIVTVCYNSVATIERTITSVLCQSFFNYEYIIIDGASKDGTLDVIKKFEPVFQGRLRCISEPDKGIYDAFTKGCKLAEGYYVWIVNSDDFLEPNALNIISNTLEGLGDKEYVISFGMNFRNAEGNHILQVQHSNSEKCKNNFNKDSMGILHPATIVPKSIYEKIGYYCPDFKIIGDIDWFHRAYSNPDVNFLFRDDVITNMCDGGISNVFNFRKSSKDRILFLKRKYKNPVKRWISYLRWVKFFYSYKRRFKRSLA